MSSLLTGPPTSLLAGATEGVRVTDCTLGGCLIAGALLCGWDGAGKSTVLLVSRWVIERDRVDRFLGGLSWTSISSGVALLRATEGAEEPDRVLEDNSDGATNAAAGLASTEGDRAMGGGFFRRSSAFSTSS